MDEFGASGSSWVQASPTRSRSMSAHSTISRTSRPFGDVAVTEWPYGSLTPRAEGARPDASFHMSSSSSMTLPMPSTPSI